MPELSTQREESSATTPHLNEFSTEIIQFYHGMNLSRIVEIIVIRVFQPLPSSPLVRASQSLFVVEASTLNKKKKRKPVSKSIRFA